MEIRKFHPEMKHIENIQKLFSKSFVENPLVESFEVGKIHLPTGNLVACDPLITRDMNPFSVSFPVGEFPVLIHKERQSNCVAYVEVIFINKVVHYWEMALTEGQDIQQLKPGEIFGYPVESGMGCLMDVKVQQSLNRLEDRLYQRKGEDFRGIYEEFFHQYFFDDNGAIDQFAYLKPSDNEEAGLFAFETGYGEGFYASYIGFDEHKNPVKILTEFIEILN